MSGFRVQTGKGEGRSLGSTVFFPCSNFLSPSCFLLPPATAASTTPSAALAAARSGRGQARSVPAPPGAPRLDSEARAARILERVCEIPEGFVRTYGDLSPAHAQVTASLKHVISDDALAAVQDFISIRQGARE